MSPAKPSVAVAGGGIAGLAAAYRLLTGAKQRGLELDVSLLDAAASPGGSIGTVREGGFVMEKGPDCFLSTKPAAVKLAEELGLGPRLIGTNPLHRKSYIARAGRLYQVPEGFHLLAPSKFWPFATTGLFSLLGKVRMGLELLLPRKSGDEDESLEQFVVRRLGREALERAAQPMIGGIYTADPRHLSLQATMPQFLDMEREHGSLLLAMWRARRARERSGSTLGRASGARYDLFLSFDTGLSALVEELGRRLPQGSIQPGVRVTAISPRAAGGFELALDGGRPMAADAVLVALPAPAAASALAGFDPELAGQLRGIPYASVATVNVAFERGQIDHPLDGMGFVVPAIEGKTIVAASFSSVKFAGRAPDGMALVRAFVGGAMHPYVLEKSDSELVEGTMADLREYLHIRGEPKLIMLSRYPNAMPQYQLGHLDRISRIEAREAAHPGLALAGNAFRGVGLGDCVASAERAVTRVLDGLSTAAG